MSVVSDPVVLPSKFSPGEFLQVIFYQMDALFVLLICERIRIKKFFMWIVLPLLKIDEKNYRSPEK
jgi:hypothetical protein